MRFILTIISFLFITTSFAQEKVQKIKYKHADEHRFDRKVDPDAQMMIGHVSFEHDGTILSCDSAVFYQGKNIMRAFGSVIVNQADTLKMYSDYLDYHGDSKLALANGNVRLIEPSMTLKSDTVRFDRNQQIAYYPSYGEIKDSANTLTSLKGTYHTTDKKLVFTTDVTITNDKYVMKSNHLTYYTNYKTVYFYGPSTITSTDNFIYCENGFYDTRNEESYFKKNSYISYGNQTLEGDSIYYDRRKGFGSANKNIVVNDTTKNLIIKGEYAEYFENNDSTFVTDRAVAINIMENDSLFIHGDTLMMTMLPKSKNRLMRVFHKVKMYKNDMQGKCDSLIYNEEIGEIKMLYDPIVWSGKNQMTSDTIIVTNNSETEKLDSLKLINNGFIISNDTIDNFNQIKGKNIYGKFKNNELDIINVVGNSETIYFARNEQKELIGINKAVSSYMLIRLKENEINEISFITDPEAELSPNSVIPENARKLKGFSWRNEERINSKEDIFVDSPLQINSDQEAPKPENISKPDINIDNIQ
ncbi:MAG: OstA-like protein [Bacteroidota bacterium]